MIYKTIKSFKYAFQEIWWVFKSENNAKVHAIATLCAVISGIHFGVSKTEWLWILLSIALVWITEIINTAVEKLVDIVSPQYLEAAGKVKDLTAAAVLVAALFALACAGVVLIPYLDFK